jgi:hypothetical protein
LGFDAQHPKGRKEKEKFLLLYGKKNGFWRQMTISTTYLPGTQVRPSKKNATWLQGCLLF